MIQTNEFFSSILGFVFGIIATLLAQSISRKQRLADARKINKIENIHHIRKWMEAYRDLFECEYPQMVELVLAHKYLSPRFNIFDKDDTVNLRVYKALVQYKEARKKYEIAERSGIAAIELLNPKNHMLLRELTYIIKRFIFKQNIMMGYEISHMNYLFFPRGLPEKIASHLEEIHKQKVNLFELFPDKFLRSINWKMIDSIEPNNIRKVIHTRLAEPPYPHFPKDYSDSPQIEKYYEEYSKANEENEKKEIELANSMDNAFGYRVIANREIDYVLSKLEYFEEKWIPPLPG